MKKRSFSYLRAYRRRWSLSEEELTKLLGAANASHVCRFETGERVPLTKVLLGAEVIFGVPPRELFPGLYEQVEDAVMGRAARLHEQLEGKNDRRSTRKRELLEDMMRRATRSRRRP